MPESRTKTDTKKATHAAERASGAGPRIVIEGVGSFDLPSTAELGYLGGIAALAAFGLIEWPLAVVLGAGHLLTHQKQNRTLRGFGEALDAA